ncbi:MAG: divalent-cation tolerance protein CutA [Pyrinomonadaceae bacterium]
MIVVITTTPTAEAAELLAEKIVIERLAACVQVIPQVRSFYYWQGEVRKESECLLLIKTLAEKYDEIENFIRSNHSHSVPEIVAIEAERFFDGYGDWVKNYLT